ncbi:hypothetical protein AYO38_04600 [bacterium SCGC AG-212-C10]|nr:hypothetical protein AYO38_04600 [bacterium SCGC AG-212-C10]
MATATIVPSRDIFVEANGIRHHLIARGAPGTPVVMMVHGLAGQAHAFDGIASHLAANYHVYCIDVRGRGESNWGPPDGYHTDNYVADLEAVRAALGLEHFSLVGTSMGGIITMNYTPAFPERVERAVINDIGPEIDPRGLQRIFQYVGHAPEAFQDMKAVVKYYHENYAPMVEHLADDQIAEFARHNVRKDDTGLWVWKMDPAIRKASPVAPSIAPWDAFNGIKCPVLVLRGANSDILSAETATKMRDSLPDCRLAEIPGVGHAPVLTEPVAVSVLDSFLAGQ